MKPTYAPGMEPLWMRSVADLRDARNMISWIVEHSKRHRSGLAESHGFVVDRLLLNHSEPFAWSAETIKAVLTASRSIPTDAAFSTWNLNTSAVWWWFEEPLPFKTLEIPEIAETGVRALNIGWVEHTHGTREKVLGVSAWCDDPQKWNQYNITPSQTWTWPRNHPLGTMLAATREAHERLYGPGGKWEQQPAIGVEAFMLAAEGLSRFILAGLAWINQKVVQTTPVEIDRKERKRLVRDLRFSFPTVRLVSLRRSEKGPYEPVPATEEERRPYSCRWVVEGHFRNQACGPGRTDHRLVWISPYLKGPEDKPLKMPVPKVYVVNR